jgi:hypothetical protein
MEEIGLATVARDGVAIGPLFDGFTLKIAVRGTAPYRASSRSATNRYCVRERAGCTRTRGALEVRIVEANASAAVALRVGAGLAGRATFAILQSARRDHELA